MLFNPILVLLGFTVLVSVYAWSNRELLDKWMLNPSLMNGRPNEWYRFLSSGFIHADLPHLAFNMLAFYSFAGIVMTYFAQQFGNGIAAELFLLLYLGGIIVSDLPTYFRHHHDPSYRSLGASGGVASVIFASILLYPVAPTGQGIQIFLIPVPIQPFVFSFLYLLYSYYMGRRRGGNINHDAHFYGALYGFLLTAALLPQSVSSFFEQITRYRFFQ